MNFGIIICNHIWQVELTITYVIIYDLYTNYLGYQYSLLFPYGEDGYRHDINCRDSLALKRNWLSIRKWFCFRIQTREGEMVTILRSRTLFQQFVEDLYTMIEFERLSFIRNNQSKLRVDKYSNLCQPSNESQTEASQKGKWFVLPSTFVGGRRFMDQLYFDGMTIWGHVGFPYLFVTCNLKWPKIWKILNTLKLSHSDWLDITARVFKIKFEKLLSYLTNKHILDRVIGCEYSYYSC